MLYKAKQSRTEEELQVWSAESGGDAHRLGCQDRRRDRFVCPASVNMCALLGLGALGRFRPSALPWRTMKGVSTASRTVFSEDRCDESSMRTAVM